MGATASSVLWTASTATLRATTVGAAASSGLRSNTVCCTCLRHPASSPGLYATTAAQTVTTWYLDCSRYYWGSDCTELRCVLHTFCNRGRHLWWHYWINCGANICS